MSSFVGSLISEPTPVVLVEITGTAANNLVLEGRALPYRPLTFSGKMRAEFNWYPGNPVATVQVLGAEESPTTINGMWKDRFMAAFDTFGVPILTGRTAIATFNGNDVANVRDLVEIVEGFRLRGQLIEFGWDQFIRQGILVRFNQTWLRREDVEWEMEFQWINRGEPETPVAFGVRIPALDIFNQISSAVEAVKLALDAPFAFVSSLSQIVDDSLAVLDESVAALADIADKSAQGLLAPLEVARSTLSALQTVKEQAQAIVDVFESLPAKARRISAGIALAIDIAVDATVDIAAAPQTTSQTETSGIANLTHEQSLESALVGRDARSEARTLKAIASQRAQEVEAQTIRVPNIDSIIAIEDQDLRDISSAFYDTPEEWKRLLTYNNLSSSKLTAGQIILVPPLSTPDC